jgi:Ca-activated chloride channel family protein
VRWASPELLPLLWALVPLLLLLLGAERARRAAERALGDVEAIRRRWDAPATALPRIRSLLLLLATAAAIVAMARPQAGLRLVSTTSIGPDVVIALDLSESMRARDARPDRMVAARRELSALLSSLEGSSIGLVGFAGSAHVLSPLTTDLEGLRDRIEGATPEEVATPGSDIGAAVALAGQLLRRPGERPRAVVLVTDGEQLEGEIERGLPTIRAAGASLVVLGLGTEGGSAIPIIDSTGTLLGWKRDASGREVRTRLDAAALRKLARDAGGQYEWADGSGRAGRRAAAFARGHERGELGRWSNRSLRAYDERFHWLAALAAFLLAAEMAVPRRRHA